MRIYANFTEVRGPYGGANAFLRTLVRALEARGVKIVTGTWRRFDLALVNALTNDMSLARLERIAARGKPVVHRKVGYRVSGSPEMRRVVDGVVWGDRLQIEFTPHVAHTVFQSAYSRDVFLEGGFEGPYTVIHNGVDERRFHPVGHEYWKGSEPIRMVISTWSTDENKGFGDYRRIDAEVTGRRDLRLTLVGRVPEGTRFRTIRVVPPLPESDLARELRSHHVLLQLARYETCSNALIEGINCGLPAVYLDSGSNREVAEPYGVEYRGSLIEALDGLRPRYAEIVERIPSNPFRISLVVERYLDLFERILSGDAAVACRAADQKESMSPPTTRHQGKW